MAQSLQTLLDAPIIELDSIDSTNNYAMRLIDADTAQAGLSIVAQKQTQGKGQRGRTWYNPPAESLLMSIIYTPEYSLEEQFIFNATVAVAIAEVLNNLFEGWNVKIKWPNDIIIDDKKAGGVLIENVLRGNSWIYSVIGFGLNVSQSSFPVELPYATSLKLVSGKTFPIVYLFKKIRENIFKKLCNRSSSKNILKEYNDYLFRKNCEQYFIADQQQKKMIIYGATEDGKLMVSDEYGKLLAFVHGKEEWLW